MRICCIILFLTLPMVAQSPTEADNDVPTVVTFVAPAYPRAAKDQRKMGHTVTRIKIGADGSVVEVKTVSANQVFEDHVLEALKRWRFKPSNREQSIDVTCSFEFVQNECEGTNLHPITGETYVTAELPAIVHIKTGLQCIEITNSQH